MLDFCCGSGIIAGAVREREPSAELTLLDADAAALEAARKHQPTLTKYFTVPVCLAAGVQAAKTQGGKSRTRSRTPPRNQRPADGADPVYKISGPPVFRRLFDS